MVYRGVALGALWLGLGVAYAQVYPPGGYPPGGYPPGTPGGYPPGSYPPGTYPPGTGGGIPRPGGRGKSSKKAEAEKPLPSFRGAFKRMDNKSLTIELEDHREFDFKRTGKTRFLKDGKEVQSPPLKAGDGLSVEATEDAPGFFTAVNVYLEKAAAGTDPAKVAPPSGAAPETKASGAPPAVAPNSPPPREPPAATPPPPAPRDPDDPGPPKLRRGQPNDAERLKSKPLPANATPETAAPDRSTPAPAPKLATATAPASADPAAVFRDPDADPTIGIDHRKLDALIRKASDAALEFTETLPNYYCREVMARYDSESRPASWRALDVITMNLVYDHGKEEYRDLAINGKPMKKNLEEVGGAWSTGEFGTVLIDLFSPATAAEFNARGGSRIAGIDARVYAFDVDREHSHWSIHVGSQSYNPAYHGSVWIDPKNGRVMRIEMQAYGLPDEFPADRVEMASDYEYVRLGDVRQYLLPAHSETLTCNRGTSYCARNAIDFRNYHKFTGESTLTFEGEKK